MNLNDQSRRNNARNTVTMRGKNEEKERQRLKLYSARYESDKYLACYLKLPTF